jgi:hypothetical protein
MFITSPNGLIHIREAHLVFAHSVEQMEHHLLVPNMALEVHQLAPLQTIFLAH